MGLFDSLKSAAMDALQQNGPAALQTALSNAPGGLQGVIGQLQSAGLGDKVNSWLSNGANAPVSADELKAALGSDQVKQLAAHFGVDPEKALNLLAQHLPAAVDQASPGGTLASN